MALIEFDRPLDIPAELCPADIENTHLDARIASGGVDETVEASPRGLHRLEAGMVNDGVQLLGQQLVDGGDQPVDQQTERGLVERGTDRA